MHWTQGIAHISFSTPWWHWKVKTRCKKTGIVSSIQSADVLLHMQTAFVSSYRKQERAKSVFETATCFCNPRVDQCSLIKWQKSARGAQKHRGAEVRNLSIFCWLFLTYMHLKKNMHLISLLEKKKVCTVVLLGFFLQYMEFTKPQCISIVLGMKIQNGASREPEPVQLYQSHTRYSP